MYKSYAGIGSRKTPLKVLEQMYFVSSFLAKNGYVLRSGGAGGADRAFENGCISMNGEREIYLPWKGFNGSSSGLYSVTEEALEMASEIHPNWEHLSQAAQKLHARNCYQILGKNLDSPCDFVVCWTKDGLFVGGTRTALVLARKHNIKIFNLALEEFDFSKI